jgi:hypothetical protein
MVSDLGCAAGGILVGGDIRARLWVDAFRAIRHRAAGTARADGPISAHSFSSDRPASSARIPGASHPGCRIATWSFACRSWAIGSAVEVHGQPDLPGHQGEFGTLRAAAVISLARAGVDAVAVVGRVIS